MYLTEELGEFVERSSFEDLAPDVLNLLKIRILDSLGCAIGALDGQPIRMIRAQVEEFGGSGLCSLIGGGATSPDRAAFYNGALVRYLDFNDSYLAKGETCHPSDNLSAVLAAAEYANASGQDLLTALAVAYQVQCRLSDAAPVRARGFDHTTQGAYAVAAGVSRALGLDSSRTAHALAIAGTAFNALRITRTGQLSHWKALAYPNTAFGATHAAFLAMRGITGPLGVFEGNKGFMEAIAGRFYIDWSAERLDAVRRTIVKRFNAEIHSQPVLEAVLELRREPAHNPADIERVSIDIFDVAFHIIGGGEEGDKRTVRTKEEADHSLPYMVSVAWLDGQVMPAQYAPERIGREDVQNLLRKVEVRPSREFSDRFPAEMPARVTIFLRGGRQYTIEKQDYAGFHTRPMTWAAAVAKFGALTAETIGDSLRNEIKKKVAELERISVSELLAPLRTVGQENAHAASHA